jgi:hypothetical protein
MAITITGGKYASAAITTAGTTTVTCSSAPFVSGNFAVARRVDLYNAAGTTFKGMAFVRAFSSTSVLQLESEFFDPKTGAVVTQVVGDTVLVSKNWADVVQTGIAVANNVVTVSDTITFGTASTVNSCAFHDEDKFVVNTVNTASARLYDVAGGFLTFGHLQDWATRKVYGSVSFYFAAPPSSYGSNSFTSTSTAARLCMFGGAHVGSAAYSLYFGCGQVSWVPYGTDWAHLWCLGVSFNATDVVSVNSGGAWTTGANHILESCSYVGSGTNLILVRWGNGVVQGGTYKFLNGSSAPISVFGADANGTFTIGAPAGSRAVVLDMGASNTLWRSDSITRVQTLNITNLISTDYRAGSDVNPESLPNTNATKNLYFKDTFTGLQNSSSVATIRNSAWTIDNSVTSTTSADVQVLHSTNTGHGAMTGRGPWTYRVRKFGFDEIEGAIAEASYPLGTAGTAFNVAFGGFTRQTARVSLGGVSEATALAIAGVTVTDHGASPVTWQSKQWSITVTVDTSTYPGVTAQDVFRHIKAGIAQLSAWNGKTGALWHVLSEESGSSYVTQRGASGGAGASIKGVRVINSAGNAFNGFATMTADDGTTYSPPALVYQSVTVSGLVAGSRIQIYDTASSTELANVAAASTTYTWTDPAYAASSRTIRVRIAYASGVVAKLFVDTPIGVCGVLSTDAALSYLASQSVDAVYNANAVDGSAVTGITIVDAIDRMQINIAGGTVSWAQIYAYNVYWLTTSAGIQDDGSIIVAKDQANYIVTLFKIKNTSSTPLKITGGYGVDSVTGSVADILDTTGGSIFPVVDHVVSSVVTVGGVNVITGDIATVLAAIPSATDNADAVRTDLDADITNIKGNSAMAVALSA